MASLNSSISLPYASSRFRTNASSPAAAPIAYTAHSRPASSRFGTFHRSLRIRCAESGTENVVKPAVTLSPNALNHLNKMRADRSEDICLRIGVRQGGCSGMSYTMDFENRSNLRADDSIIEHQGFTMVCDPKSLLYLYGMQLDYSDALIGGGFSFTNPNATSTCGCGKSFSA